MPVRTQDAAEGPSKQSTVFLGDSATGTWSELATDDSQYLQNVTAGAGNMSEASPASARFNISHPRTIGVHAEVNTTDTGSFFLKGSGSNILRFDINSAGTLRAVSNNTTVGTLALPGLTAGGQELVMAWASRPNPLTTGASDAVQSWLYAANLDAGTAARAEFTHAAWTTSATTARWGSHTNSIYGLWFENRCQSFTEVVRDWDSGWSRSAPSSDCEFDLPPLPLTQASGVGDADELHGPVPLWAAVHNKHALRRHWTPLANENYRTRTVIEIGSPSSSAHFRYAPGSSDYWMLLSWLVPAPVPQNVTHAYIRLHVRSWVASGSAVPLGLRVYSMSRPPDWHGDPIEHFQVGEVVTRDDAGAGEWDIKAIVRLAVGEDGWTYFCPAFAVDPAGASANDANARLTINALHAVPCFSNAGGAP